MQGCQKKLNEVFLVVNSGELPKTIQEKEKWSGKKLLKKINKEVIDEFQKELIQEFQRRLPPES